MPFFALCLFSKTFLDLRSRFQKQPVIFFPHCDYSSAKLCYIQSPSKPIYFWHTCDCEYKDLPRLFVQYLKPSHAKIVLCSAMLHISCGHLFECKILFLRKHFYLKDIFFEEGRKENQQILTQNHILYYYVRDQVSDATAIVCRKCNSAYYTNIIIAIFTILKIRK